MCRVSAGQRLAHAWPQQLDASGAAIVRWVRSAGGVSSREVLAEVRQIASYVGSVRSWDAAIIQVGIVDCAPRPFGRHLQEVIDRIPGLRPRVIKLFPLLVRIRSRPWVRLEQFERTLQLAVREALEFCGRVVLVEIVPPGPGLEAKLMPFAETVAEYNAALRGLAALDPERVTTVRALDVVSSDVVLPDGHHLTVAGHTAIAAAVATALSSATMPSETRG